MKSAASLATLDQIPPDRFQRVLEQSQRAAQDFSALMTASGRPLFSEIARVGDWYRDILAELQELREMAQGAIDQKYFDARMDTLSQKIDALGTLMSERIDGAARVLAEKVDGASKMSELRNEATNKRIDEHHAGLTKGLDEAKGSISQIEGRMWAVGWKGWTISGLITTALVTAVIKFWPTG